MRTDNAIFVTGATGLVGGLLVERLAKEYPERVIYCLTRTGTAIGGDNTHPLQGDITHPRLGLSDAMYARIGRSVDTVVHCAASTKFNWPLAEARQVNVQGTANIVNLARRSRHLKTLLHVSSTYIAGKKAGPLAEAPAVEPNGWFNSYEQSKFEAERFLCDHVRDIPWVIARLSTVVGNSHTGHVSRFNYFHQLLRLAPRNLFPFIPGDPASLVDLVADDWVTDSLCEILRGEVDPGRVFHLCAGPDQSLPAQEVLEAVFRLQQGRRSKSIPRVPAFVSMDRFESWAADLRKRGETTSAKMAELIFLCLPHLGLNQHFLNDETSSFLMKRGIAQPRLRDFLPRIIHGCC